MFILEQFERTLSRRHHCPKCGCSTVVITHYDVNDWGVACKQCGEGPGHTVSKRQAKIAWRLFAESEGEEI